MVDPANSMAQYRAPSTPILPITYRMMSFAEAPAGSSPSTWMRMVSGTLNHARPVAMPTPASVEPTPVLNAPMPPYVQVCESAPMMRSPGPTMPFSGRSACSMPMHPCSK